MTADAPATRALALPFGLALLAALAATGCHRGEKSADCKAVGAAYASLLQKEIDKPLTGRTSEQKTQVLSLIPQLKEAMVKECEEKKWDDQSRRCVVESHTKDDLERCRPRKDPGTAEEKAGAEAQEPESPAAEQPAETPPPAAGKEPDSP